MTNAKLPTLLTSLFDAACPQWAYIVDFSPLLVSLTTSEAERLLQGLEGNDEGSFKYHWLGRVLPPELDRSALKPTFPTLQKDAERFVDLIGGIGAFPQWVELQKHKDRLVAGINETAAHLERLQRAEFFRRELNPCETLKQVDGESFGDPDSIVVSYSSRVPFRPDNCSSDAEWAEHDRKAVEWTRLNCTPYAWATKTLSWAGVDPKEVRRLLEEHLDDSHDEYLLDELYAAVCDVIDDDLTDNHHEDADGEVVDRAELKTILATWLPDADSGNAVDLDLESALGIWNAKQTITSYFQDTSRFVSIWHGVTKAECVEHARSLLVDKAARLSGLAKLWEGKLKTIIGAGVLVEWSRRVQSWEYSVDGQRHAFRSFEDAVDLAFARIGPTSSLDPVVAGTKEVLSGLLPLIHKLDEDAPLKAELKTTLLALAHRALGSEDLPLDKISRWLGYIQRALEEGGVLSVDEERNRTRPIFYEAYRKAGIPVPPSFDASEART